MMSRVKKTLWLKALTFTLSSLLFVVCFGLTLELWARIQNSKNKTYGILNWSNHDILGWIPTTGKGTSVTEEFEAHYDINSYGMNDKPLEESLLISKTKIMALGDSHTFAAGVSQDETWPNVLEEILFKNDIKRGSVYNCAVSGYNLGQYLLQMRRLAGVIKPGIVLIGFTTASDLYDLIPPRKGGFIFGADRSRVYFDLDENGNLIELHDLAGKKIHPNQSRNVSLITKVKNLFSSSAFFQRFKRSNLAMWVMIRFRPKGKTLWASPDTALAKKLDDEYLFRWKLAEAIIAKIAQEARQKDIKVVLISIPYLPQVYDTVWESTFGRYPEQYDRWIAGERLKGICARAGIYYIDLTTKFVEVARKQKEWLHYPIDSHPNPEGHRLIAQTVADFLLEHKLAGSPELKKEQ